MLYIVFFWLIEYFSKSNLKLQNIHFVRHLNYIHMYTVHAFQFGLPVHILWGLRFWEICFQYSHVIGYDIFFYTALCLTSGLFYLCLSTQTALRTALTLTVAGREPALTTWCVWCPLTLSRCYSGGNPWPLQRPSTKESSSS